ncbi:MAG: adenine deaminase [Syntrophaceae bacterium]|nr:adenine deaminase [Syntrophaceae bacterium]
MNITRDHAAANPSFPSAVEAGDTVLSGNVVDVVRAEIYPGTVVVRGGRIAGIVRDSGTYARYLVPGFVDAHVHIESSMLVPSEFARLAVVHGTTATVSDPHEIANVLGVVGVRFMIENGRRVPFKFHFGASPCVPATAFETAGASLDLQEVETLLDMPEIMYLSEVMNYPGVIARDPEVMAKLRAAKRRGKPIDGHAPGLMGADLEQYAAAGITTDHETYMLEEGRQKVRLGMKVQIRWGSAANNFDTLHPLLGENPGSCMFCSDDRHPDDLAEEHMDAMVRKAFRLGYDRMTVLKCATLHPVRHYGLRVGLLQPGDPADLVVLDGLGDGFRVLETYVDGRLVAKEGRSLLETLPVEVMNHFRAGEKRPADFAVPIRGPYVHVIDTLDGQVITGRSRERVRAAGGYAVADPEKDVLKVAVINRYQDMPPALGFVRNFGLKRGAIASSVAHDSHNVVVVGATDEAMARAANLVIRSRGGLALADGESEDVLPLPVAGLMTTEDGYGVARKYEAMTRKAKEMGSRLRAPFMAQSFLALLVIPDLKLSDRGLFDGRAFRFLDLFTGDASD